MILLKILLETLYLLLSIVFFAVFLLVVISFFPRGQNHPIVLAAKKIADPFLNLAKKITPRTGMLDLSPLIIIITINILQAILHHVHILAFGHRVFGG